jgi:type IX secretion system PorP/SprF family membrane protein
MRREGINYLINKNALILCLLILFISGRGFAQQQRLYNYNQYADNLTPVNAAYALLDKAGSVSVLGSKQLVGIDGAPQSFMLTANFPIPSVNASVGFYVLNEKIAVENQTAVNAYFAKAIQLTEQTYLSVALNVGVRNYTGNYSQLDPFDTQFSNDIRETKPNLGFSIMLYNNNYYMGLSVPELTIRSLGTASTEQPTYLRSHYYFTGAYLAEVNDYLKIKPATLILYTKGSPMIANLSSTAYLKDQLGLGINYRTDKTTAATLSILSKTIRIAYSYQFGTSAMPSGTNTTTHEIGIRYRFGNTQDITLL